MDKQDSRIKTMIQELRNRRVFRASAVYLGSGFALLEAADIVVPMLGLPAPMLKYIFWLLILGFPVAIGLAWTFQITPEGLRRSPRSGEKQTEHAKPFTGNNVIIVLLLVIVGLLAYPRVMDDPAGASSKNQKTWTGLDPKAVAVLPFTNFSSSEEDAYFADGIHDDILTQLSKIHDLKVISRTTMIKYKGSDLGIDEIARELGAANVLEGSVRRAGDEVRIVAQLIKAQADEHLWAETYDREYADIFAIQTDVARQIARALQSTLTPEEEKQLDAIPTTNMDAYDYFLKGNTYWYTKTTKEGNLKAVAMYERAIELDPLFGLAYARLSIVHSVLFQSKTWDPSPERMEMSRSALEKAQAIIPEHSETRFAQGIYNLWCLEDPASALLEFEIAAKLNPNSGEVYQHMGQLYLFSGKWDKAGEYLNRAFELDPHDVGNAGWLGGFNYLMRDFEKAELYYRKELHVNPEMAQLYRWYADVWAYGFGDTKKALQLFEEGALLSDDPQSLVGHRFWHELNTRDYPRAMQTADQDAHPLSKYYYLSVANHFHGDNVRQSTYLDSALEATIHRELTRQSSESYRQGRIGLIYAMQGKKQEAIQAGKKAVQLLPVSSNALTGPDHIYRLAEIYTLVGEPELALEKLTELMSYPNVVNIGRIKLNPFFDSLRQYPQYLNLVSKYTFSA